MITNDGRYVDLSPKLAIPLSFGSNSSQVRRELATTVSLGSHVSPRLAILLSFGSNSSQVRRELATTVSLRSHVSPRLAVPLSFGSNSSQVRRKSGYNSEFGITCERQVRYSGLTWLESSPNETDDVGETSHAALLGEYTTLNALLKTKLRLSMDLI